MSRILFFATALFSLFGLGRCTRHENVPQKKYVLDNSILKPDSLTKKMMQLTTATETVLLKPDSVVLYRIVDEKDLRTKKREATLGDEFCSVFNYYLLSGNRLLSPADISNSNQETISVIYYRSGKTIAINFTDSLDAVSFNSNKITTTFLLSDNKPFKKLLKILKQYENQ